MVKKYFDSNDMVTKERQNCTAAAKMPRPGVIVVVRDKETGYINAAPYSGGVLSIKPFQIVFGVKSWDAKFTYKDADEFVVSIPKKSQIDHMWVMACSVPHGINEIEIANWNELPSKQINTPGIKECPINLECKTAHFIQLKQPLRAIIVADVIGINMDASLLNMRRSEAIKQIPIFEASWNTYTGLYGPSVLDGEMLGYIETNSKSRNELLTEENNDEKVYISRNEFYYEKNQNILSNAIWPMPSYVLCSTDEVNRLCGSPVTGGLLMSARPAIQVPVLKDSIPYKNIKRNNEFVLSIPVRSQITSFEELIDNPNNIKAAGLTALKKNQINTPGIMEYPVNIDCKVVRFDDIPGSDYSLLIGEKVGISVDNEILEYKDMMDLYSQFLYSVRDKEMKRRWSFHDKNNLSVKPLPSWGSRYYGGWLLVPENFQYGMYYWLIELVESAYLSKAEFDQIRIWLTWWRREGYLAPEDLRSELKQRLTTLFKMMVWAHRDFDKWHKIKEYLAQFPLEKETVL